MKKVAIDSTLLVQSNLKANSWDEVVAMTAAAFPRIFVSLYFVVGSGVLVVSIGYSIGGPILTAADLSLSLNLVLTGAFIGIVRKCLSTRG